MDLDIAQINIETLRNLEISVKLCADNTGKLTPDNRWGQTMRRTITRDSKQDLLEPIGESFEAAWDETNPNYKDIEQVIIHAKNTFRVTYPSFDELQSKLEYLLDRNYKEKLRKESGRTLSNMIDQKRFSFKNGMMEYVPHQAFKLLLETYDKIQLVEEESKNLYTLYDRIYCYRVNKEKTTNLEHIYSNVVFNTLMEVLGYQHVPKLRVVDHDYTRRNQALFQKIVREYILQL